MTWKLVQMLDVHTYIYQAIVEGLIKLQNSFVCMLFLVGTSSHRLPISPSGHANCHISWLLPFHISSLYQLRPRTR